MNAERAGAAAHESNASGAAVGDRAAAERAAALAAVGRSGVDDEVDAALRGGCLLEHRRARLPGR